MDYREYRCGWVRRWRRWVFCEGPETVWGARHETDLAHTWQLVNPSHLTSLVAAILSDNRGFPFGSLTGLLSFWEQQLFLSHLCLNVLVAEPEGMFLVVGRWPFAQWLVLETRHSWIVQVPVFWRIPQSWMPYEVMTLLLAKNQVLPDLCGPALRWPEVAVNLDKRSLKPLHVR